jgi:hypothetical protein
LCRCLKPVDLVNADKVFGTHASSRTGLPAALFKT